MCLRFDGLNKAKYKYYICKGIQLGSLANLYLKHKQYNRKMDECYLKRLFIEKETK